MSPSYAYRHDGAEAYKDSVLNGLATDCNVAQFISFAPDLSQRFAWICGRTPNQQFDSLESAMGSLLSTAESHKLNIRSFKPGATKGNKLIENIDSAGNAVAALKQRASHGFFTIANEVIPLMDGGVSGVTAGGVIEFAPGDTPKCVDKPGVTSLPLSAGTRVLKLVYGLDPDFELGDGLRVEFSIHPIRRGVKRRHTIIWEVEPSAPARKVQFGRWPNRFSQFIGDKAYGLMIAHLLGCAVPRTTVFCRNVAPFTFGEETGTRETWLRTCPRVPIAGKYPTTFGWEDPFTLMSKIDHEESVIASVMAQESAEFVWSGAARSTEQGPDIEGTPGRGDGFMLGATSKEPVPATVANSVASIHDSLIQNLRSVKFEWVWDGSRVWVVQLHNRPKGLSEDVIYPGEVSEHRTFDPRLYDREEVLEQLRALVAEIRGKNIGVIVTGDVGVTSHVGDILSEAKIPSRVKWWSTDGSAQLSLGFEDLSS